MQPFQCLERNATRVPYVQLNIEAGLSVFSRAGHWLTQSEAIILSSTSIKYTGWKEYTVSPLYSLLPKRFHWVPVLCYGEFAGSTHGKNSWRTYCPVQSLLLPGHTTALLLSYYSGTWYLTPAMINDSSFIGICFLAMFFLSSTKLRHVFAVKCKNSPCSTCQVQKVVMLSLSSAKSHDVLLLKLQEAEGTNIIKSTTSTVSSIA